MSTDTEQIQANTASIQAIEDNAKEINEVVQKQTDALGTDCLLIQTIEGVTLRIPLSALEDLIQASGATTINYSSIGLPQLFNPDAGEVVAGTADFALSSLGNVAFVTVNGQVLDDSEYSLAVEILTVTPNNGYSDITDEILVFQHVFSTIGTGGVKFNYAEKSADYTFTTDDYHIEQQTSGTTDTLPLTTGIEGTIFLYSNVSGGSTTLQTTSSQTIYTPSGEHTSITVLDGETYSLQARPGGGWKII